MITFNYDTSVEAQLGALAVPIPARRAVYSTSVTSARPRCAAGCPCTAGSHSTGYRAYEFAQLASLHRLVALRDLGLSLQQIGEVLPEDPTVEQLRGMLRLRRAELAQQLTEDEARLRRVEAHLRALDGGAVVSNLDVVMKTSEPIRVVEVQGRAAGFGHQNLGPVFERLVPQVLDASKRATKPAMMVAWYDEPDDDGSVVVHVGFDIGEQDYKPVEPTSLTVLPAVLSRAQRSVRPHTQWLRGSVELDRGGSIVTGAALGSTHDSPLWARTPRDQYLLETSLPGVFVAGDVRSGPAKRVASAVGEGSVAAPFVREHLASHVALPTHH